MVEEAEYPLPEAVICPPAAAVVDVRINLGLIVIDAVFEEPLLSEPRTECEPRAISGMLREVLENAPFASVYAVPAVAESKYNVTVELALKPFPLTKNVSPT